MNRHLSDDEVIAKRTAREREDDTNFVINIRFVKTGDEWASFIDGGGDDTVERHSNLWLSLARLANYEAHNIDTDIEGLLGASCPLCGCSDCWGGS